VRQLRNDLGLRLIARTGAALALAVLCGAAPVAAPQPDPAAAVVTLTNGERVRQKRPPLAMDPKLMRAAQLQAQQMARLGTLEHELRGAPHPRAEDRLRAAGYAWQAWAENIASGQESAADVMKSWMKSKGHRQNILERSLTEMGAGYAKDRGGRTYWVQVFARPLPQTR
jgi:uncharacterized protein YkwD